MRTEQNANDGSLETGEFLDKMLLQAEVALDVMQQNHPWDATGMNPDDARKLTNVALLDRGEQALQEMNPDDYQKFVKILTRKARDGDTIAANLLEDYPSSIRCRAFQDDLIEQLLHPLECWNLAGLPVNGKLFLVCLCIAAIIFTLLYTFAPAVLEQFSAWFGFE